ncbi:hypothetical protein NC652_019311 [Populus alba x Populus x berolinensis]|nr:hypothetical protein NC652_019311 [Populus alba x Populus x berolinensis]
MKGVSVIFLLLLLIFAVTAGNKHMMADANLCKKSSFPTNECIAMNCDSDCKEIHGSKARGVCNGFLFCNCFLPC